MSETRLRVRESLSGKLTSETLDLLVDEVLAIKKRARGWCPECSKQVWVEISDPKAVVSALNELLVQAEGRPGVVEAGVEKLAPVYRLEWVAPGDEGPAAA